MKSEKKRGLQKLALIFSAALIAAAPLTGCLDLLDEEFWEDEPSEHWWDNPVAGGHGRPTDHGGYQDDEYEYDEDLEWWNILDESWTIDDWELTEDGVWMIFDEETQYMYVYDEEYQEFAAMDAETEEIFVLDMETGEWIPAE